MLEHNEKVRSGYYRDRENFPDLHPDHETLFSDEQIKLSKNQFTVAHCCTVRSDSPNDAVYIRLHY
jgi:hypothetical protein